MSSLGQEIVRYADEYPSALGLVCVDDGVALTRAELLLRVRALAAGLAMRGVGRGDRVMIALPTSVDFVVAFWASQYLGAVAVPVPPVEGGLRLQARRDQIALIGAIARPAITLVATEEHCAVLDLRDAGAVAAVTACYPATGSEDVLGAAIRSDSAHDVAVIQFTSGSTRRPRGCALSQAAVMSNALAIAKRTDARPLDSGVCWLPLSHDMGLMSGIVVPVVSGATMRLQSAGRFIANPLSWLRMLAGAGRSHTAVPNFALSLVNRRLQRRGAPDLDLSKVMTILCGAEPIDADVVREFFRILAPCGLRPDAFHAAYGMAEVAVMFASRPGGLVTSWRPREAHDLADEGAITAEPAEVVGVGQPIEGACCEIRAADGSVLEAGVVGEVHLQCPSLMDGYYGDVASTSAAIQDGWLKTGDLGYLMGEDLYIIGRADDVVIVCGQNIYPWDVEAQVSEDLGVDRSRVALVARDGDLGARELVLFVENRDGRLAPELHERIRTSCYRASGLFPADTVALKTGEMPRTTSGKIQRAKLRALATAILP